MLRGFVQKEASGAAADYLDNVKRVLEGGKKG
jgi:hypothetical protein